jgi:UDP-glucose:(heptosyl)LPS alpha-1,3-glucosyltransferase
MQIALIRQRVTATGGAETTLGYLVRGMIAAGHDVTVYGTDRESAARAALGPLVAYVRVPVWGGKTLRLISFALNTRRLLKAAGPQVGFSLERVPGLAVYRAGDGCHREWLARRAPCLSSPARFTQNFSLFHQVMLSLEARLFAHPGLLRVIANSRQVQEDILRLYEVDPARLRLIYNGLDRQRFHPLDPGDAIALRRRLGAPENSPVVLFVGSGFDRKGLPYLFQAFGRLTDKTSQLWVVGKGNVALYHQAAKGLGVADRVKLWGPVAETAPFYQAATVLALPTLYDPCSNVVLEALACGTPAITSAANGAAEFITPGENGDILSQPDGIEGLTAALAAFLARDQNPEVRRAATQSVAGLSWEATVAQTLEVLAEVIP